MADDNDIPPVPLPPADVKAASAVPPVEAAPAVPQAAPAPSAAPPAYGPPATTPPPAYGAPAQPAPPAQPGYATAPPAYGAQPAYAPSPYAAQPAGPAQGLSITSMVLGLVGLLFALFGWGFLISLAAIITGHMAQKRQPWARGFWLTGIITGYVGGAINLILFIVFIGFFAFAISQGSY